MEKEEIGGDVMKTRVIAAGLCLAALLGGCQRNEKAKAPVPAPEKPAQAAQPQPEAPKEEETEPRPQPAPTPQPVELASVSTALHDKRPGRLKNLKLACDAVNGAVIPPGASFSFNQTVGERTEEKGYEEAIVFKDREKVQEVGGGICQLSSTLYLAAQRAGLEVTERHPHQMEVDYVEKDQDAAVDYGNLDLVFVNHTDQPIQVGAWLTENEVIVSLTVGG